MHLYVYSFRIPYITKYQIGKEDTIAKILPTDTESFLEHIQNIVDKRNLKTKLFMCDLDRTPLRELIAKFESLAGLQDYKIIIHGNQTDKSLANIADYLEKQYFSLVFDPFENVIQFIVFESEHEIWQFMNSAQTGQTDTLFILKVLDHDSFFRNWTTGDHILESKEEKNQKSITEDLQNDSLLPSKQELELINNIEVSKDPLILQKEVLAAAKLLQKNRQILQLQKKLLKTEQQMHKLAVQNATLKKELDFKRSSQKENVEEENFERIVKKRKVEDEDKSVNRQLQICQSKCKKLETQKERLFSKVNIMQKDMLTQQKRCIQLQDELNHLKYCNIYLPN